MTVSDSRRTNEKTYSKMVFQKQASVNVNYLHGRVQKASPH